MAAGFSRKQTLKYSLHEGCLLKKTFGFETCGKEEGGMLGQRETMNCNEGQVTALSSSAGIPAARVQPRHCPSLAEINGPLHPASISHWMPREG